MSLGTGRRSNHSESCTGRELNRNSEVGIVSDTFDTEGYPYTMSGTGSVFCGSWTGFDLNSLGFTGWASSVAEAEL